MSPSNQEKRALLQQLIDQLQSERDALEHAARAAHEAATHEESRAEDQHDTRGLEASYLAGAQAQRAAELQAQITVYRNLDLKALASGAQVAPVALVTLELESDGDAPRSHYLLVPHGGGAKLSSGGRTVQVIGPRSPMGEALIGRRQGDWIDVESGKLQRSYQIVEVK